MTKPDTSHVKIIAVNRKARHDYTVESEFEAGMVLLGSEVKALREGRANLKDSYAKIKNGELFVFQLHISEYPQAGRFNHDPLRVRKLLMHKHEIMRLVGKIQSKGLTLIPLSLYFKEGRAKISVALCQGKKKFDKRRALQEREQKREMDQLKRRRR
ncbi:MAG: SsrA-binding protein SmpB [Thermodesulfobacteriota bacterium]